MLFFFAIFFVVVIFSHLEINVGIEDNTKKKIFLVLCFFFYLLSFLRWEYGPDWDAYYRMYELYTWDFYEEHEIGFSYIIVAAKSLIDSYTFVLFVFSSVLFYCQTKGILKMCNFPLVALLVLTGTYFCNVGYVRQYVAVAITFYAIYYIEQRRFFHFLLFVLLATSIHYSSLVFLPAWWIYHANISRKKMMIFLLLSLFASSLMSYFLQNIGGLLGQGILMRTEGYVEEGYDYSDNATLSPQQTIIKAIINRGGILLIGFYLYDKACEEISNVRNLFNLYCFGSVLFFLSSPIALTLSRMSWFYDFAQILIIPSIFVQVKNRIVSLLIFSVLTLFLAAKLYLNINSYEGMTDSYKFIPIIENIIN